RRLVPLVQTGVVEFTGGGTVALAGYQFTRRAPAPSASAGDPVLARAPRSATPVCAHDSLAPGLRRADSECGCASGLPAAQVAPVSSGMGDRTGSAPPREESGMAVCSRPLVDSGPGSSFVTPSLLCRTM